MNRNVGRVGMLAGVCAVCVVACLVVPVGAQERREGPPPRREAPKPEKVEQQKPEVRKTEEPAQPAPPRKVPSVRFQATVFQVELGKERIAELDSKTLATQGPTPAALAKFLQQFGPLEVLYRIDQVVPADGQRNHISVVRDAPYVTGTLTTTAGQVSTTVARQKVGGQFEWTGYLLDGTDHRSVQASLRIEVSGMTGSSIQVGNDVMAPVFWRVEQSYGGATELGKPVVLLSIDGGHVAGGDKPLAFVTLTLLSEQ